MKIAIIAWGSLYWDPGSLQIEPPWNHDGPQLPVEFARVSSDGRLTLVLVPGVPVQPTLWVLSRMRRLEDAADDLRKRERTPTRGIGSWPQLVDRAPPSRTASIVRAWVAQKNLDAAVWTALPPRAAAGSSYLMNEAERLGYLRQLQDSRGEARAKEYIEKAPMQIATPFRELVRRELGWGVEGN